MSNEKNECQTAESSLRTSFGEVPFGSPQWFARRQERRERGDASCSKLDSTMRARLEKTKRDPLGTLQTQEERQALLRAYSWFAIELIAPRVAGDLGRLIPSYLESPTSIKDALANWMSTYGIQSEWVESLALRALHGWTHGGLWFTPIYRFLDTQLPGLDLLDVMVYSLKIGNESSLGSIQPPPGLPIWKPADQTEHDYLNEVKLCAEENLIRAIEHVKSFCGEVNIPNYLEASTPDARHEFIKSIVTRAERYCKKVKKHVLHTGAISRKQEPTFFKKLFWFVDVHVLEETKYHVEQSREAEKGSQRQAVTRATNELVELLDLPPRPERKGRPSGSKDKKKRSSRKH